MAVLSSLYIIKINALSIGGKRADDVTAAVTAVIGDNEACGVGGIGLTGHQLQHLPAFAIVPEDFREGG